jgi:hypothetical protein
VGDAKKYTPKVVIQTLKKTGFFTPFVLSLLVSYKKLSNAASKQDNTAAIPSLSKSTHPVVALTIPSSIRV